jgi:hypothetical protein
VRRRAFLGGALAGAAALGLRRLSFGDVTVEPKQIGIGPTLVIVNPVDDAEKHARGRLVGAAIYTATDDLLARLDGVVVVVAPMRSLDGVAGSGEPLVVYIDKRRDLVVRRIEKASDADLQRKLRALLPAAGGDVTARAKHAREKLIERPIPGSHWAHDTGCGVHVDGLEGPLHKCGMGHVPKSAARFLWLFTTAEG